MEDVLALYAEDYDPRKPVLCMDEKSKQLLEHAREGKACTPGKPHRTDYE